MGDLGNVAGHKPGWSCVKQSDNPQDQYGLTAVNTAKLSQFIGFSGKDVAQDAKELLIVTYEGTSNPTVTDFALLPLGTLLVCPFLSAPRIYIKKAATASPAIGDWHYLQFTQVT